MQKLIKLFVVALLSIPLAQCVSSMHKPDFQSTIFPNYSVSEYNELIEKYTGSDKSYDGFNNQYQLHATLMNTKVVMATLGRQAQFMAWEPAKEQSEREKAFQEMSSSSEVYLSFFSPTREYNDLVKPKSMWKVYLEHNGIRYEGKVKKVKLNLVQLQTLYPYHNRFSTGYMISFGVPMTAVEASSSKFIITSSLGSTELTFPRMD